MRGVGYTVLDDFCVFWASGRGGYPLWEHFLGSSCGGRPAGGRKVVFGVLLDGFGTPFWEPRRPFRRYFRRRFFRCFLVAVLGALLDGFWLHFGRFLESFLWLFPDPWILRFVWPLLHQTHILGGQISLFWALFR